MVETVFRGKSLYTRKWALGNYCKSELLDKSGFEHFIIEIEAEGSTHMVDPKTVGMYTGLFDKNLQRVFEGDVTEDRYGNRWVVFRAPGGFGVCRAKEYPIGSGNIIRFYNDLGGLQNITYFSMNHEVIGNIHDNPKLIGGKE